MNVAILDLSRFTEDFFQNQNDLLNMIREGYDKSLWVRLTSRSSQ
jgi:hypothetical protein